MLTSIFWLYIPYLKCRYGRTGTCRSTAVYIRCVLKVLRRFLGPLAYADSSRGFYPPWVLDTAINSPVSLASCILVSGNPKQISFEVRTIRKNNRPSRKPNRNITFDFWKYGRTLVIILYGRGPRASAWQAHHTYDSTIWRLPYPGSTGLAPRYHVRCPWDLP